MPSDFFASISNNKTPPVYKYFDSVKWTDSLSSKYTEVRSPIDNEVLGLIPVLTHAEIDQAILQLKAGRDQWQKTPLIKRKSILHLAADWLREHESMLTSQLQREIGKSVAEAKDEILRSADMIDYFAQEGVNIRGEEIPGDAFPGYDNSRTAIVEKSPLGIILCIPPFNYPVNLSVSKIAPALMTGNSVILKPPTQGSIANIIITEIFRKAGLPPGVLATVTGPGENAGNYLATHPTIDMIAFTGSSGTGKAISKIAGMIPLLFECGGNNAALILPDCNFEATASEIARGAFSYSGQRCTAIKYVLGLSTTIDKLIPYVTRKTKEQFIAGDPRIPENNLGPLVNDESALLVEKRILMAKADGAKIVLGGKRDGRYITPTILSDVSPYSEIVRIETFGPVLSFIKADSIAQAVKIINSSDYGLQSSIFTRDEGSAISIGRTIDVGTIQINSKPQRGPDHFPFMGIKGSGVGVQGIRYTLEAMTRPKSTVLNKPE